MENITLLNGDCLEVMKTLPSSSVHSVITDPPYSSGTRKEGQKGLRKSMNRGTEDEEWFETDSLTTNGFVWLMRECAREWKRLLVPGGHILVFIDWRMLPHLSAAIESADLRHAGVLVWDKTHFGMGSCFRNQHELILHFTNGKGLDPQRRDVANVLSVKPIRNGNHPTEKPVELIEQLISVVTPPDGVVLDCFSGSSSTLVAADRQGRRAIGIELSPHYCEVGNRRLDGNQQTLLAA